jgi:hypothetical protein
MQELTAGEQPRWLSAFRVSRDEADHVKDAAKLDSFILF